jgi:H+/Cl- antiporter ClcA
MFNITFSLALVYTSTWLVVNVAPEAGGAGVAEVTAYLNGCFLPKVSCLLLGAWGQGSAGGRRGREAGHGDASVCGWQTLVPT